MNGRRGDRLTLIIMILLAAAPAVRAIACPGCVNAVKSQPSLPMAVNTSVLFMLAMPFLLLAGFSGYFFYLIRRRPSPPIPGDDQLS